MEDITVLIVDDEVRMRKLIKDFLNKKDYKTLEAGDGEEALEIYEENKNKINGNVYKVAIGDIEDNIAHVEVNGTPYKVEMEKAPKVVVKPVARPAATSAPAAPATPVVKPAAASTGKSGVKSPLPGVILDIKVNVGDTVKKGQVIIILEAMKMENNINADKDGKITAINVNKGDSVLEGTDLVIIE